MTHETDTPEKIVRALADSDPWTFELACKHCSDVLGEHTIECLYVRAVEWIAEHPESEEKR